jgi:hypothetical protein
MHCSASPDTPDAETPVTTLQARLRKLILAVTFGLLAIAMTTPAHAASPKDIIIVLDNSGSMRGADPAFAMRGEVMNLVARLGADDRVGLMLFDERVRMLRELSPLGDAGPASLTDSLARMNYRGQRTDIPAAVERAVQELQANARPEAGRVVVFLTDGVVDTGDAGRDADGVNRLRGELIQAAISADVAIYSLAFTDAADTELLQAISQGTGAASARAASTAELATALEALHSSLQQHSVTTSDAESTVAPAVPTAEPAAPPTPAAEPSTAGALEQPQPQPQPQPPAPVADDAAAESVEEAEVAAASEPVAAADAALADGPPPAAESAAGVLAERLGITPEESEQLVAGTGLPANDVLALVDEAGLTLEELRGLGTGQTLVSTPGEASEVIDTAVADAVDDAAAGPDAADPGIDVVDSADAAASVDDAAGLATLAERLGVSLDESRALVDSTQLPPEDLLALLDEAGLTLEELQGLAVGETVISKPGEGVTTLRTPQISANLAKEAPSPASVESAAPPPTGPFAASEAADSAANALAAVEPDDLAATAVASTTPEATPASPMPTSPTPADPVPADASEPDIANAPARPAGTPMWVILTTVGGVFAVVVGALMALRPRRRAGIEVAAAGTATAVGRPAVPLASIPDAWLVDIQRHSGEERVSLGAKPLVVGRVPGTDPDRLDYLVVNQPTIGRRHAMIEFREFAWFISDQGSVNGTFVNGERIGSTGQRLRHGDRIRFHRYEFEFAQPEEVADQEATLIAQLPGEATLIADRTLAAASTAAVLQAATAVTKSEAGSGAGPAPASTTTVEPALATTAIAPPAAAPAADSTPDFTDSRSGLDLTSDPTVFNPAAGLPVEQEGLDMFMASQVFGATTAPEEDSPATDEPASSDGSTVVLDAPMLSVDFPLESEPPAQAESAAPQPESLFGEDDVPGAGATPERLVSMMEGPTESTDSAFTEDFFGTHEMPAMPQAAAPEAGSGTRAPADVFFPEAPAFAPEDGGSKVPVQALDVPPADAADGLFAGADVPPADASDDFFSGSGASTAASGNAPSATLDEDDAAFFATLVQGAPAATGQAPAAPDSAGSGTTTAATGTGAPPASSGAADDFFATVIQPAPQAAPPPSAPAAPAAPAAPEAPANPPAAATPEARMNETLRVAADSTVVLGGSTTAIPPATAKDPSGAAVGQKKPSDTGTDEGFDDFFNDDSSR